MPIVQIFPRLFACAALFAAPVLAADDSAKLPLDTRVFIAAQIYSSVPAYFAHWRAVPSLNFDQEFKTYLKAILESDDRRAFGLATMEFVAKLSNGHTWYGDWWLRRTQGQSLGFYAHPIDGQWTITESDLPGLHIGDIITHIDREPIEAFYQRHRKYLFASDERWRQRMLFESPYFFPPAFDLEIKDGAAVHIIRSKPFVFHGDDAPAPSVTKHGDFPVLRIPSFSKPAHENSAIQSIRALGKVPALILDLRGNHGGSVFQLTAALMDRPYRSWDDETPASVGMFRSFGMLGQHASMSWSGSLVKPQNPAYTGPLYVLVDDGCYSACEEFVMPFKESHRAIIIGERTAGSSGQAHTIDFGDGMALGVSIRRHSFPDGAPFEGIGIAPDIEVHITAADLRAGRDPVLDRALKEARP